MYGSSSPGAGAPGGGGAGRPRKVTAPELRARKTLGDDGRFTTSERIVMVTAYDFTMARLLDRAGVDVMLVGDSLGMVFQGRDSTIPVTLDEVCYHCRAVARGAERAHVVGDMPFMSYQISPAQALESAGKLVKDGMAESVKLEGGADYAEHTRRIVRAGIPVMGHVGLLPQSMHALGGFKVQGKSDAEAQRIVADAQALEDAGAYAIVLEAVPPDVAARVTAAVSVPTIGIGAGPECDGQVLVCADMLGLTVGRVPRFVKRYAELGEAVSQATAAFAAEVRSQAFPAPEHCYAPGAGRAAPSPRAVPSAAEGAARATEAEASGPRHPPSRTRRLLRPPIKLVAS
ncbi:MAG: 3-methyl-2-oxobutanoate hydroxymethyltransferase [Myxococcales bacterium]|nr:3-methyl-2-oxobutanoate hydroxymethyltransferase [Myxococcales bacterium]